MIGVSADVYVDSRVKDLNIKHFWRWSWRWFQTAKLPSSFHRNTNSKEQFHFQKISFSKFEWKGFAIQQSGIFLHNGFLLLVKIYLICNICRSTFRCIPRYVLYQLQ